MQTFAWFCVIMALVLLYGMRIRSVIGYVRSPLMHWYVGATLGVGLFLGAVLTAKLGLSMPRDAAVALHGVVMFVGAWLGLRYWSVWRPWDVPAAVLALVLVAFYFTDPRTYNNIMFGAVTLGCAVGGYYVTKRWLVAFSLVMACFDGYAVWGSDIMEQLIEQKPGPFPTELLVASFFPRHFSIGVMDALLAAMIIVGLVHHRGIGRAAMFALAYAGSIFAVGVIALRLANMGNTLFAHVPMLVILAPLACGFLLLSPRGQAP
ncbi:MAG TPA: hypothetical protein VD862_04430 [Candidatus Paceibacterota bacterium]|nr:hypothetical protein [Candidatus Paceibacterota bacterium]